MLTVSTTGFPRRVRAGRALANSVREMKSSDRCLGTKRLYRVQRTKSDRRLKLEQSPIEFNHAVVRGAVHNEQICCFRRHRHSARRSNALRQQRRSMAAPQAGSVADDYDHARIADGADDFEILHRRGDGSCTDADGTKHRQQDVQQRHCSCRRQHRHNRRCVQVRQDHVDFTYDGHVSRRQCISKRNSLPSRSAVEIHERRSHHDKRCKVGRFLPRRHEARRYRYGGWHANAYEFNDKVEPRCPHGWKADA